MKSAIAVSPLLTLLLAADPANALDTSYVNGTKWAVAGFEIGRKVEYNPVPWTFFADQHVSASGKWVGLWTATGDNKVSVSILHSDGRTDMFEVIFLSQRAFVALKDGEIYRVGQRVGNK